MLAFTGLPSLFSMHYSTVFRHLALHVFAYLGWIERVKTTFFISYFEYTKKMSKNLQNSSKIHCVILELYLNFFFAQIKYSLQPLNSMAVGRVEIWQEVRPKKGRVINGKKEWKKGRGKLAVPAYKSFYTIIQWGSCRIESPTRSRSETSPIPF